MTSSRIRRLAEKGRKTKQMANVRHGYDPGRPRRVPVTSVDQQENNRDEIPGAAASDSDGDHSPASRRNLTASKNMRHFQDDFREYQKTHPRWGLLYISVRRRKRYLHASKLVKYFYLNPAYYHPNIAVRDITTRSLLAKLSGFRSVNNARRYRSRAVLTEDVVDKYMDCFEPAPTEQSLCIKFGSLVEAVVHEAKPPGRRQLAPRDAEMYSAVEGFLCKPRTPDQFNAIDVQAGYMGEADRVLYFGLPDENQGKVFAAIEFKNLQTVDITDGHRWFTVSGALLAQTLQSMFGHDAPVAVAFTEQGFKVYFKEEVNDETLIHCWPPGQNFHCPTTADPEDEGLIILADVIRIATRERVPVQPTRSAKITAPSTPNSAISSVDGDSHVEDPQEEAATQSPGPPGPVRRQKRRRLQGDQLFRIRTTTGELLEVKRLCLADRFTEEELREIARLEDELEDRDH